MDTLFTVGHGQNSREQLTALLAGAGIDQVVDIRRFPGSKRHPDMHREKMGSWLPEAAIAYRWEERLGGRRTLTEPGPDIWWKVDAFRAYAAYTRTSGFREGLAELISLPDDARVTVLCSESVWWRCHRRLIADVVSIEAGIEVQHVMPQGRVRPHVPAEGARVGPHGWVVWDGDGAVSDLKSS